MIKDGNGGGVKVFGVLEWIDCDRLNIGSWGAEGNQDS